MKTSDLKKICEDHVNDLITAIAETRDEKRFHEYLDFCSRFHRYSFRNRVLIWCSKPDATFVAGYNAWPKMGRHVKKGSSGIPIFAPMAVKNRPGNANERDDDSDCDPDEHNSEKPSLRFKVVYVYDVSQTEGDPLPNMDTLAVEGETGLLYALETFTRSQGIKLGYSPDKALDFLKAAGISAKGRIQIKESLNTSQRFYVLAHELAHEFLHGSQARRTLSTKVKELEADATAYVVSRHFGLQTQSSVYLALYRVEEVDVKESLDRIVFTASRIIQGVHSVEKAQSDSQGIQDAA